jgi:taurine dioxygenase
METIATALQQKAESFTVRPVSPALGAEIAGVDLRDPIDATLKQKLLDAWHQHLVILLRHQTLDEDAQVRFAETFGAPAKTTSGRAFSVKHPSVMLISNIREDGKPIGALPDGEMHFHTDQCHQETPAKATLLYAIEIPSRGGNTLFANAYTAYETLPEDIKRRIADGARSTPTPRIRRCAPRTMTMPSRHTGIRWCARIRQRDARRSMSIA